MIPFVLRKGMPKLQRPHFLMLFFAVNIICYSVCEVPKIIVLIDTTSLRAELSTRNLALWISRYNLTHAQYPGVYFYCSSVTGSRPYKKFKRGKPGEFILRSMENTITNKIIELIDFKQNTVQHAYVNHINTNIGKMWCKKETNPAELHPGPIVFFSFSFPATSTHRREGFLWHPAPASMKFILDTHPTHLGQHSLGLLTTRRHLLTSIDGHNGPSHDTKPGKYVPH